MQKPEKVLGNLRLLSHLHDLEIPKPDACQYLPPCLLPLWSHYIPDLISISNISLRTPSHLSAGHLHSISVISYGTHIPGKSPLVIFDDVAWRVCIAVILSVTVPLAMKLKVMKGRICGEHLSFAEKLIGSSTPPQEPHERA